MSVEDIYLPKSWVTSPTSCLLRRFPWRTIYSPPTSLSTSPCTNPSPRLSLAHRTVLPRGRGRRVYQSPSNPALVSVLRIHESLVDFGSIDSQRVQEQNFKDNPKKRQSLDPLDFCTKQKRGWDYETEPRVLFIFLIRTKKTESRRSHNSPFTISS